MEVRRASETDAPEVVALVEKLRRHALRAPTFWVAEPGDHVEWLSQPGNVLWLACGGGDVIGCMGSGPASDEACTIIRDGGTASIVSTYVEEHVRRAGVATALLERALTWAREQGYKRCAVDFDSMNAGGVGFWLRWFRPVCHSLVRRLDDRIAPD
jgi:GNAT superfamily N-acetyltransferase